MPEYIAICLPKKLITKLLGETRSTIEKFLEEQLPRVIEKYEDQTEHVCLSASSPDVVRQILTWKNPDLFVIHIHEDSCQPPQQ